MNAPTSAAVRVARHGHRAARLAGAALAVAAAASLVGCAGGTPPADQAVTAGPDATQVPGTGTVPPAPGSTPPAHVAAPPPTTTATGARPSDPALTLTHDGFDGAKLGQDYEVVMAHLIAKLGTPDEPGSTGNGYGSCGVKHNRDVRWGDLTVSFTDTGSGLRFSGFYWGKDIRNRNATTDHPVPSEGPGTPRLDNPFGIGLGTQVRDIDELTAKAKAEYPDAHIANGPPIKDPAVNAALAGNRSLNIVMHSAGDEGWFVEAIWALTPSEIVCH